jgi:hypothetical protein
MHTSWSDFDTADIHADNPRPRRQTPNLLSNSIAAQEKQLAAQEQHLKIQQAIAASSASTYKNRKEGIRAEFKKARLRVQEENQAYKGTQAKSGAKALDPEVATNETTAGTKAEPDMENGLNRPEQGDQGDQPEHAERSAVSEGRTLEKKLSFPCVAFLWIIFIVLAIVFLLR